MKLQFYNSITSEKEEFKIIDWAKIPNDAKMVPKWWQNGA